jgi:hypothetical protein
VCPRHRDPEVDRLAVERLAAWLDRGYRFSLGHPCLSGVARGRCQCHGLGPSRAWADHVHRWIWGFDGSRVLTSQPYGFGAAMEAELLTDTAGWGLEAVVEPEGSWWYPGETTLIVIRAPLRVRDRWEERAQKEMERHARRWARAHPDRADDVGCP